ncbi:hypothetical protein, partial [Stenotrophomonas maltophilia group sp. RNC7]|uniref:hypothetical protein n=1 Tax=Stenotrophomonas maltophilia group sp. RNC7 TaxID=3071467 RepID=UPI0027E1CFAF
MFVFVGMLVDSLLNGETDREGVLSQPKILGILFAVLVLRPLLSTLSTLLSEQAIQAKFSPR